MKDIFIIGGGTSLKNFDFSKLNDKITIVSNKSIFDVPNANYFITTDYTFINYLRFRGLYDVWRKHPAKKIFVANCIANHIQNINGKITDLKYNLEYDLQDFDEVIICKSAKDIGFDLEHFNSGYNSGFCTFQYAILMGYKNIYLLGMDMISTKVILPVSMSRIEKKLNYLKTKGIYLIRRKPKKQKANVEIIETHYHKGYNKNITKFNQNLINYCEHFCKILVKLKKERPDINIISCSKISKLNKYVEYKSLEEI